MKKTLLFILLFVISIGSTGALASSLYTEHNNVTFDETILYGDSSVADGLRIKLKTQYLEHMYWNTSIDLGDSFEADTEYRFYPRSQNYIFPDPYEGLTMYVDMDFKHFDPKEKRPRGLGSAYKKLYDSLEPGEEKL